MEKVSEMTTEPIVGKFYLVECVKRNDYGNGGKGTWLPIVGKKHTDAEIGITQEHWHRDPRFVPLAEVSHPLGYKTFTMEEIELSAIITELSCTKREIRLMKRKCLRTMPVFPRQDHIHRALEPTFVGRKILCGKCPHRAFPLESLPQDESGHVICNGHGLKIDMTKGEVIVR